MEYYAIFIPNNTSNFAIKSFYTDKIEALGALKLHKDARMKAFPSSEEAIYFYLNGPSEGAATVGGGSVAATAPGSPIPSERKVPKSPFIAPTSQKLVAFRKLIEANNIDEVRTMIQQNPRYLISSGDTPTILKEGPRYNALHITAIEGRSEICRLILETIESPSYIELLHGQRTSSTDEVTAILLDLYLNTPDKCRNETPLHFAAKLGWAAVVKELIAFPQCQVKPNADGLYPREIICSRAKQVNNTPETREAISALLKENFFVPLLRTEDNSMPPIVGKPFSPTELPKLNESRDKLSARWEIKAYAGPMEYEKAVRFYKRWKTPPRLKVLGPSKIQSESKLSEMRKSSTPIKAVPRRLFANRSFDGRLQEGGGGGGVAQEHCYNNNNTLLDSSLDESVIEPLEEKLIPDDNGNHLRMNSVPYTPKRLFFTYRNHLADNSFDTDGSYCNNEPDDGNFSYVCDETQTLYEKSNVTESPSFKERSIRATDFAKGAESVGRTLAKKEHVDWREYWNFVGTFCNVEDEKGLLKLEQYLAYKKQQLAGGEDVPGQDNVCAESPDEPVPCQKERSFNDELNMICESTEKMSLNMADELQRTPVSNPYRCLLNSLHVFGIRLVNSMLKPTAKSCVTETFQTQIRQLEKLLENYRNDAAFRTIDFSKVHAMFAYLIVTNVPQNRPAPDGQEPSSIWKPLLRDDSLNEAAKCVAKWLSEFSADPSLLVEPFGLCNVDEMERDSKMLWESNAHIVPCSCRTDASSTPHHTAGKGILERMNKRREKRAFRTTSSTSTSSSEVAVPANEMVVDFHTYRSGGPGKHSAPLNGSFEEDERYYSCSDSEDEQDDDTFFTPPSSPKALRKQKDQNGNRKNSPDELGTAAKRMVTDEAPTGGLLERSAETNNEISTVFLTGSLPTQQDFDVWNVLKLVDIDPQTFPHVHEWKCAMLEYSS